MGARAARARASSSLANDPLFVAQLSPAFVNESPTRRIVRGTLSPLLLRPIGARDEQTFELPRGPGEEETSGERPVRESGDVHVFEVDEIDAELRIRVKRAGGRTHTFRVTPKAAMEFARQLYLVAVAAVVKAAKGVR